MPCHICGSEWDDYKYSVKWSVERVKWRLTHWDLGGKSCKISQQNPRGVIKGREVRRKNILKVLWGWKEESGSKIGGM